MNMNKTTKYILLSLLLIFLSGCGGGGSTYNLHVTGGEFIMTIYSPYDLEVNNNNNKILYETKTTSLSSNVDVQINFINQRFGDFSYTSFSPEIPREPFCKIGGQYKVNVFNDPNFPPAEAIKFNVVEYNQTHPLYYCHTTKDLLEKIDIPQSWENSKIAIYCNDGRNSFMEDVNFDFISNHLNVYKTCSVRNIDINESIIFGFDVGNIEIDSNLSYFSNNESSLIMTNLVSEGVNLNLTYEKSSSFFKLEDVKYLGVSRVPLEDIFTIPTTFDLSRLALFLTNGTDNKRIYGFETPEKLYFSDQRRVNPIYKIIFENYPEFSCKDIYGAFSPSSSNSLNTADFISCFETDINKKEIHIHSRNIDNEFGQGRGFSLFKNSILDSHYR